MIQGTDLLWIILCLPLSLIVLALRDYNKFKQQKGDSVV